VAEAGSWRKIDFAIISTRSFVSLRLLFAKKYMVAISERYIFFSFKINSKSIM